MRAKEIMTKTVLTVSETTPIHEAMAIMSREKVSGLPVTSGPSVIGIVTEGDVVKHLRQQLPWFSFLGAPTLDIPMVPPAESWEEQLDRVSRRQVKEIMTKRVVAVPPDAHVSDIATLMAGRRIKRVLVLEADRLVGIVSRGDLIRSLSRSQPPRAEEKEGTALHST